MLSLSTQIVLLSSIVSHVNLHAELRDTAVVRLGVYLVSLSCSPYRLDTGSSTMVTMINFVPALFSACETVAVNKLIVDLLYFSSHPIWHCCLNCAPAT